MYPVADKLQARFADSFAVIAGGQEHAHNTPLIRLAHFARLHKDFFRDPDLDPLLAERWAGRRRTLSVASAEVRRVRPLGRRRTAKPGMTAGYLPGLGERLSATARGWRRPRAWP